MIRKIAAYSFIIFANIVLLAHSFIPHHHQLIPSIECSLYLNFNEGHKHTPMADNHHHEGESSNSCILTQTIILPTNKIKTEAKIISPLHIFSPDFLFSLSEVSDDVFIPKIFFIKASSDRSFAYQSRISTALGLRAPPKA